MIETDLQPQCTGMECPVLAAPETLFDALLKQKDHL
jgi:hypothetical protein